MADTPNSLTVEATYGFDMAHGYVTMTVDGNAGEKRTRKIQFTELTADNAKELCAGMPYRCRTALIQEILRCWQKEESKSKNTDGIYLSSDKLVINATRRMGSPKNLLERFSGMFEAILHTESSDDRSIGKDFCVKAKDRKFTPSDDEPTISQYIQSALEHPLFWTSAEKISYYKKCLVREKSYFKSSKPLNYLRRHDGCNYSLTRSSESPYQWYQSLSIGKDALKISWNMSGPRGDKKMRGNTIMNLAKEKWESGERKGTLKYNENSWLDFLRFFRNTHAHFDDLKDREKCCFASTDTSPDDGYWAFFSRQFPGLFLSVYKTYNIKANFQGIVDPKFHHDEYKSAWENHRSTASDNPAR